MTLRHMLPSFSGSSRLSVGGDCPVCDLEPGSLCHFQAGVAVFPCPPETFLEGIGLPCARRQRLRRGRTGHLTQPASQTSERAHGDSGHPAAPAACPPAQTRPSPRLAASSPKPCKVAGGWDPHLTDEDVRLRHTRPLSRSLVVRSRQGVGCRGG